jgi:uncharacterized radical SAM superfamily Fe-S cluster-containing enzyme
MSLHTLSARWKVTNQTSYELPCFTKSLCPVCLKVIDAELYEEDDHVFMNKGCQEHGAFNELISSDAEFFKKMRRTHYEMPQKVENPHCHNTAGCPNGCGLCDEHLSTPVMVNIDLTNGCNLNCPICFASSNATGRLCEISLKQLDKMLDDTMKIRPYPPSCMQLVGGEPTIHKDFIEAVRHIKARGIVQVQAASNGLKFAYSLEFAQAASEAGLDEVYLQFDGLSDDIYQQTRGRKLLEVKFKAIENIKKANMRTVLVPTLVKGLNDDQVGEITRFAISHIDAISAISWQPVAITGRIDENKRRQMRYTTADLARSLQERCGFIDMYRDWYPFSIVEPFVRLIEVTTKKKHMHCSPHPHCGCATYLVVDKQKNTALPLPAFVDIEPSMETLNKMATRIEKHSWAKKFTTLQAMHELKKHFHADRAPEGWGFDEFLEFIKSFVEPDEQLSNYKAPYMEKLRNQRFGILLMASMHFQDSYNYELDRSRHCVIFYAAPDGKFYPFCTWNSGPCHRYRVQEQFSKSLSAN